MTSHHRLADELIPAVVGTRPSWLLRGPAESMGALYATLARQRGIKPPRITVIHKETRNTPTMFNRNKRTEFTTTAGSFDAWHFSYSDPEWHRNKLILVGLLGTAFEPGNFEPPNEDGQIISGGHLGGLQADIASTASRLAKPAGPHSYLTHEAAPKLAWAVKQLL
ncbi:hypothetical protein [Streptomyces europaeiscabiei]|uniref:hypothetical protein n=1 Tax=Streptomyces europaeiscabiei TaxID=146819 RepID=UPI002E0D251F|nr:hypothetical protein OHB30_33465 [Streptomyces europaeiscabiei]